MIGALDRAFAEIYNDIPMPILEAAFTPWKYDVSMDQRMRDEVITKRVLGDCSINGGRVHSFMLDKSWALNLNVPSSQVSSLAGTFSTYLIPPEERAGRDLVAFENISYPYAVMAGANSEVFANHFLGGRNLNNITTNVIRSHTFSHATIYPSVTLMAGNIVKLDAPQFSFIPWKLTFRLKYDDEFTSLDVSAIPPFAKVCVYAIKAYIYKKLIFNIETNAVFHGQEIGVMRDIVSTYADANEKYDEAMKGFAGGDFLDATRLKHVLTKMLGRV